MFKNYMKVIFRHFYKTKLFSAVNIFGLSIALAFCMLLFLYVHDEWSFDRFQKNYSDLYRLNIQANENGKIREMGISSIPEGGSLKKDIPGVADYVRFYNADFTVKANNHEYSEAAAFADANVFTVFSFPLIKGSTANALQDANSIVLTKSTAIKYFGTGDAIGQTLQVHINDSYHPFIVTAIARDIPQNSSIQFAFLLPFSFHEATQTNQSWMSFYLQTYILLKPGVSAAGVEAKLPGLLGKYTGIAASKSEKEKGIKPGLALHLQSFSSLHLDKHVEMSAVAGASDPIYSYILGAIAFFIIVIACTNFINISVARSLNRAKEIGMRKVMGGSRTQLIIQFLTESFLPTFVAFILALGLVIYLLPFFNQLANKQLSISYLKNGSLIAWYGMLLVAVSIITGIYPAFVLSAFKPVAVLTNRQKLTGKNYFGKSLVVLQFTLAAFLITGTVIITRQFNYVTHTGIGYDDKNVINVKIPAKSSPELLKNFKDALLTNSNIINVAGMSGNFSNVMVKANEKNVRAAACKIDESYIPLLHIPILTGRNLREADSNLVVVNETFVRDAGLNDPVGKKITVGNSNLQIAGVVKDYHFESLHEKIKPLVLHLQQSEYYQEMLVKVSGNDAAAINAIREAFARLKPGYMFMYQFIDAANAGNYENENRWRKIISIASLSSILIACVGLFGLSALAARQRAKEISIRKIFGSTVIQISLLFCRQLFVLIAISFVIALPVAYYAGNTWLQQFAYRVNFPWWLFVLTILSVLIISLSSVLFNLLKVAMANPVKTLRQE